MAGTQVTGEILKALHDQQAALQYAHNPVAYWQSIGGTLPPGVTAAQFAARAAASPLHKAIVDKSTGHGQMSVLDSSPCAGCIASVQFILDVCGAAAGGAAALLVPGVLEWITATMAAGNPVVIGTIIQGGSAGMALGICKSTGRC